MISIDQSSDLPARVVLRNLTSGAPWQTEFFALDVKKSSVQRLPKNFSGKGKVVGLGSSVLVFPKGKLCEIFLAVYFVDNEWMMFDGRGARALKNVKAQWSRPNINVFDAGLATLQITDAVNSASISYLRPWLRHWFEDGWALDDVDIGWVISHLASDAGAKARLLETLKKS